jgi:hypothetical protein
MPADGFYSSFAAASPVTKGISWPSLSAIAGKRFFCGDPDTVDSDDNGNFRNLRTAHSGLRHAEGAKPEGVRGYMGHVNIDVTQNVYGRNGWGERVDAVEKTNAIEPQEEEGSGNDELLFAVVTLAAIFASGQSAFNGTRRANNQSMEYEGSNQYSLQNGIWRCETCVPKIAIKADGYDHRVNSSLYYGAPYASTENVSEVNDHSIW